MVNYYTKHGRAGDQFVIIVDEYGSWAFIMFIPVRGFVLPVLLLLFFAGGMRAQQKTVIAFWNVENLFDTINDPLTNDDEFTPGGRYAWTTQRYRTKLERLCEVIGALGSKDARQLPAVIGLCEVENERVVTDLVTTGVLKKSGYRYLHRDSPDERGIDVCLLYDPARFKVDTFFTVPVRLPNGHPTRDLFVACGNLLNEPVALIVNHWPSRRGGEKTTRVLRKTAANTALRVCDSLYHAGPSRGLLLMGDFNDDPSGHVMRTLVKRADTVAGKNVRFANPMWDLHKKGTGTLAWNDSWNLFDQVLLSEHFRDNRGWDFSQAVVYTDAKLRNVSGRYAGYPFRTFAAGVYQGGYSDHFPVYVVLERSKSGR